MTIQTDLNKYDYKAFRRYSLFKYRKVQWMFAPILVFFMLISWFEREPDETMAATIWQFIAGLVTVTVLTFISLLLFRLFQRFTRTRFPGTMGPHTFEIDADGITETNQDGRTETRISRLRRVAEEKHHFFIITAQGTGYIIPKRDLDSPGCEALRALKNTAMIK